MSVRSLARLPAELGRPASCGEILPFITHIDQVQYSILGLKDEVTNRVPSPILPRDNLGSLAVGFIVDAFDRIWPTGSPVRASPRPAARNNAGEVDNAAHPGPIDALVA